MGETSTRLLTFRWSVSMSSDGTRVAIGDGNSGNGTRPTWGVAEAAGRGSGVLNIDGEAAGDYSGYSVSMSLTARAWRSATVTPARIAAGHGGCTVIYADDNLCNASGRAKTARTALLLYQRRHDRRDHRVMHVHVCNTGYGGELADRGGGTDPGGHHIKAGRGRPVGYSLWCLRMARVAVGVLNNDGTGERRPCARVLRGGGTWTQVGSDIDGRSATFPATGIDVLGRHARGDRRSQ